MADSSIIITETDEPLVISIRRMPEKFPQLIMMIFIAGLPAMQIAKQLGKHLGTVRVWPHQTFEILNKNLAQLLKEIES
jgi:DNA-directed RNA polymerase specialized sigma24 family protein